MQLFQYVASRLATYLVVVFIGITITFFLPRMMPSDPISGYISRLQSQAGQTMDPKAIQELRSSLEELYGLNGSLASQYVGYLGRIVRGFDFGPSLSSYPRPVSDFIFNAMPWTLGLLLTTTLIAWALGNMVGLLAGFFHNNRFATALEVMGVAIYPIPYYVTALVLLMLFAYIWHFFPLTTTIRPGPLTLEKIGSIIHQSILPGWTLVLVGFGGNILGMKALAFSIKEEPYVVFARLKGTKPTTIMTTYVFRNAILPQITALALSLGGIFNGALLTEILFSYPGMGLLLRTAIGNADFNMMYGIITVSIVAVATAALIIDLLYPVFDPRIRYR